LNKMGTPSYSDTCPKCGAEMMCWCEKRSPYVGGECLECGYTYWVEDAVKSLKELNQIRKEFDLKPIKKLRRQND